MTPAPKRGQSGQAIVLFAVMAAIVAFTLLTTFAIGRAVREKIQLQQAADAASYSLAVQEARTFNYFAYTNRAIVSHYVVVMALYGYMSYLVNYEGNLYALASNWGCDFDPACNVNPLALPIALPGILDKLPSFLKDVLGALNIPEMMDSIVSVACAAEATVVLAPIATPFCDQAECVIQENINILENYCPKICNDLQQVDQDLGKSGGGGGTLSRLHDLAKLHRDDLARDTIAGLQQEGIAAKLIASMGDTKAISEKIGQTFDPHIKAPLLVGALNVKSIAGKTPAGFCDAAMVGGIGAPICEPLGGHNSVSIDTLQFAANSERWGPAAANLGALTGDFLRDRKKTEENVYLQMHYFGAPFPRQNGIVDLAHLSFGSLEGTGMSRLVVGPQQNALCNDSSGWNCPALYNPAPGGGAPPSPPSGGQASGGSTAAGAEDHNGLISADEECLPVFGAMGHESNTFVYSMPPGKGDSDVHWADGTDSGSSQIDIRLGGKLSPTIAGLGIPTANFAVQTTDPLENQPSTWALLTTSLAAADEGPYGMELDKSSMGIVDTSSHTYDNVFTKFGPGQKMWALSRGLAYYHRPGTWKEPPNFYNPFWRAKLHPVQSPGSSQVDARITLDAVLKAGGMPLGDIAAVDALSVPRVTE